jgi:hypothetical protein
MFNSQHTVSVWDRKRGNVGKTCSHPNLLTPSSYSHQINTHSYGNWKHTCSYSNRINAHTYWNWVSTSCYLKWIYALICGQSWSYESMLLSRLKKYMLFFKMNTFLVQFYVILQSLGCNNLSNKSTTQLRGLSPRTNYTDRGTTACRRS